MLRHLRFRPPLWTGLFLAGGLVLVGGTSLAEEPVIVGGSGKPGVTVDLSVLDELSASQLMPGLLMPGRGPARNGVITLRPPGTAAQAVPSAPMAEPMPPMAEPMPKPVAKPMAAPKEMPEKAPAAEPATKFVLTPTPKAAKAPAPVAKPVAKPKETPEMKLTAPVVTPPVVTPPVVTPPVITPPVAAPRPARAPIAAMPDAPPPPVTLTEPKAFPPSTPREAKKSTARAPSTMKSAAEETANLAPATAPLAPGEPIHVAFGSESALLSDKAKRKLEAFASRLKDNPGLRIQLLAYASSSEEAASQARRLSLSRALVVRSFLIEKGLSSIRIDVRALGNKVKGEPADRVDLIFADGE